MTKSRDSDSDSSSSVDFTLMPTPREASPPVSDRPHWRRKNLSISTTSAHKDSASVVSVSPQSGRLSAGSRRTSPSHRFSPLPSEAALESILSSIGIEEIPTSRPSTTKSSSRRFQNQISFLLSDPSADQAEVASHVNSITPTHTKFKRGLSKLRINISLSKLASSKRLKERCATCRQLLATPQFKFENVLQNIDEADFVWLLDIMKHSAAERRPAEVAEIHRIWAGVRVLSAMEYSLQHELCRLLKYRFVTKGTIIFKRGQFSDAFYTIIQGSVEVVLGAEIKTLSGGDSFGESCFHDGGVRSATVRTAADTHFLVLPAHIYRNLVTGVVVDDEEQTSVRISKARDICRKMGHLRSPEELDTIADIVHGTPFFQALHADGRVRLCRAMKFVEKSSGDIIFKKGDKGNLFYIIVGGTVDVIPTRRGPVVVSLEAGDCFGDLALVNESPRAATVVVSPDTTAFLITIDRASYQLALGVYHKKNVERSVEWLLRMIPTLGAKAMTAIIPLATAFTKKTFISGEVVFEQDEEMKYIGFVVSGGGTKYIATPFERQRTGRPKERVPKTLNVGKFQEGEILGGVELSTIGHKWTKYFSTWICTGTTEISLIPIYVWQQQFPLAAHNHLYSASVINGQQMLRTLQGEIIRMAREGWHLPQMLHYPTIIPTAEFDMRDGKYFLRPLEMRRFTTFASPASPALAASSTPLFFIPARPITPKTAARAASAPHIRKFKSKSPPKNRLGFMTPRAPPVAKSLAPGGFSASVLRCCDLAEYITLRKAARLKSVETTARILDFNQELRPRTERRPKKEKKITRFFDEHSSPENLDVSPPPVAHSDEEEVENVDGEDETAEVPPLTEEELKAKRDRLRRKKKGRMPPQFQPNPRLDVEQLEELKKIPANQLSRSETGRQSDQLLSITAKYHGRGSFEEKEVKPWKSIVIQSEQKLKMADERNIQATRDAFKALWDTGVPDLLPPLEL